jgi:hypothetical protein
MADSQGSITPWIAFLAMGPEAATKRLGAQGGVAGDGDGHGVATFGAADQLLEACHQSDLGGLAIEELAHRETPGRQGVCPVVGVVQAAAQIIFCAWIVVDANSQGAFRHGTK